MSRTPGIPHRESIRMPQFVKAGPDPDTGPPPPPYASRERDLESAISRMAHRESEQEDTANNITSTRMFQRESCP
jgi:hypothetical protein